MTDKEINDLLNEHGSNEEPIIVKKGKKEVILSDDRIKELTSKFIEECGNEALLRDDFGMNSRMVELLIKIKTAFFPATQKSINANINTFESNLQKWYTTQKGILDKKQNQEDIIVDIVAPNDGK